MGRRGGESAPSEQVLIRVDGRIKERENVYYRRVSDRYRAAGFVLIFALALFCAVMLVRYNEYITYDNFVYLIRDVGSVGSGGVEKYSEIKYTAGDGTVFEPFGGGLALIDTDSVTLYDRSGVEVCSETESFSYPAAARSDKYLIVYDIGGESYSIYNSITRVAARGAEGTVTSASVSDEGSFVIVTESKEAKYQIQLFSSSLVSKQRIRKDTYVTDAAISRDGSHVAVASVIDGGGFGAEVYFCTAGKEEADRVHTYPMSMPLLAEGTGDGFTVIFDDAVRFYSATGELKSELSPGASGITYGDIGTASTLIVCPENSVGSRNRVIVFDKDGNVVYDKSVDIRVTGVAAAVESSPYAGFLISADGVHALEYDGGIVTDGEAAEVLAVTDTDGGTLICTPTASYPLFTGAAEQTGQTEE